MVYTKISHSLFKWMALLVVLCLGVPLLTTSAGAQDDNSWQLVRAEYGFRDTQADVTGILRTLIAQGGMNGRIAVTNQTMGGDPAVGKDKVLHIVARNRRGEQRDFTFREGNFVDVAMFSAHFDRQDRPDDFDNRAPGDRDRDHDRDHDRDRDLYIIRGYYGIQGRTVNVTEALRSMVRNGVLSVDVSNSNLGGDPAVGADKVLIVIYRFHGEEQATAVPEGNRLTVP